MLQLNATQEIGYFNDYYIYASASGTSSKIDVIVYYKKKVLQVRLSVPAVVAQESELLKIKEKQLMRI